ncbi:MAG: hypothetical protein GXP19_05815 [Gammaproteobacteria bacterium]|nr:hypothetical protein [Gammaproteobacteria bacterium]
MRLKTNLTIIGSVFSLVLLIGSHATLASTLPENIKVSLVTELEIASDLDNADVQKQELQIQPEIKVNFSKDWQLTALGRFRTDAQDNINPDNQSKAELREFYFETSYDEIFFTLGKQQIVWGKADGLKVLDVVNPQNFREFILDDFEDSRIPLWAVNAEIPFDDTVLQLLFIPDQTYHKLADQNALYTFTSPLVSPTIPSGINTVFHSLSKPDRSVKDADYGMRLSSFRNGWDLTFNYLYHYDDVPVFFRDIDLTAAIPLVNVKPEYKRTHLVGSSFSNAFDSLTLRGEVAYSIDRYYSVNDLSDNDGVIQSDEFAYVLGFDWQGIEETFLSFQLFQTYVVKDKPGLIRDQLETTLTFLYRQEFYNDTLELETLLLHNLNNDDGLIRPKIKYQWQDDISVWVGLDIFYGETEGLFGQFDDTNRFMAGIEWGV